ncbi:MAG: hypothetical protein O2V44_09545, partial [Candidatus Bathyarchaeota archaeon]|nr:hypothetical protein [Candidatus Bathyarchaeota archaeon]
MSRRKEYDYEHPSPPEVTIAFEKIITEGRVSIGRYGDDLPPGITEPLKGAVRYYMIDTTIVFEGRIEIRILTHASDPETLGELYQWEAERRQWVPRTIDCVNVGQYKLI